MAYTLGQAARATGKAKPTIARAIQVGRLAASRSADGSWAIDPAELHRVYPMNGQTERNELRLPPPADSPGSDASLSHLLAERDRLLADREETIRDLRHRLDAEAEERRRTQAQLTALLTDQRRPAPPARRSWWPWRRTQAPS
jgi:hypothetical protein